MIFSDHIYRSLNDVKDLFTAVKSLADVAVIFRNNNQEDAKLEQYIEQFVKANIDFAEKLYQTTIDNVDEPEEDCEEDELDDWT